MRYASIVLPLLLVAGCSAAPDNGPRDSNVAQLDVTSAPAERGVAAPGINVTAAPGVAFNYAYVFRLPAANIATAQEGHAQACEKLGISRCRITGMRYSLTRTNQIDAMLTFKLDPTLARAFGREGIAAIVKAEGMLTNAEITGTDAGAAIARIAADRTQIDAERKRLDAELARPGLAATARAELLRQRGELDQQARAGDDARTEQQESLATTPMTFTYESGTAIRGFNAASPFTQALDTGILSAQTTLAVVLVTIALLAPPALVLIILLLGWRAYRRRFPAKPRPIAASASATPTLD